MKRFSTLLNRKGKGDSSRTHSSADLARTPEDSPEDAAARAIRLFCESGSTANRDEEVLHLPTIVDAAESSPAAATACAFQIRTFMHKQYFSKPHVQYNAIMLIRILSDHPGASFTKNFDDKFVKSTKTLLRESQDHSVQQLLRETLDSLEVNRRQDAGCQGLITMWNREKEQAARFAIPPARAPFLATPVPAPPQGTQPAVRGKLPSPAELASRVEEARNTAKILIQFVQTTPAEEVTGNELIREFADRCQHAQRSMQNYINCDSPAPDDDTLQTLIETNERLSLASSRYQRAILASRRSAGTSSAPQAQPQRSSSLQRQAEAHQQPLLQPPPQTFGSTRFENKAVNAARSPEPAVSPITQPLKPNTQPPPLQVPASHAYDEDYDDLYDSPRATRAAVSNPFSDPVQPVDDRTQDLNTPQTASQRPTVVPWHNSDITSSFLGRQQSAADGLTMHAATPSQGNANEIDGHSNVGRLDYRNAAENSTMPTQNSFVITRPAHA